MEMMDLLGLLLFLALWFRPPYQAPNKTLRYGEHVLLLLTR